MSQKIAVAIIHGIGTQKETYADRVISALRTLCGDRVAADLVIRAAHWAPVLSALETELIARASAGGPMRSRFLRRMLVELLGDAFAYQPTRSDRTIYDSVHAIIAEELRLLALEAGPTAPLCIIAHSLGSIIASNFIYDLQVDPIRPIIGDRVRAQMSADPTPLEMGETLALLFTLGSPLALWSLRFADFGRPITMPPPGLHQHHPGAGSAWINFYDADDVIGFPIRTLNANYMQMVTEDREVEVGSALESWNPLSHLSYWKDVDVLHPIADALARLWGEVNRPESAVGSGDYRE